MKSPKKVRNGRQGGNHVDAADFLRVISTILVASYHIWQQGWINLNIRLFGRSINLRPWVSTGYMGVELLILLSGFLLYLPYALAREDGVWAFYKKRALRILPSYWFCILVMLFAFAIPERQYASNGAMVKDLLAHATFTHNLFEQTYFATPLNGAMWTLAVEVQFYILAPLICRCFRKRPLWTYLGMVAAAWAYRCLYVLRMEDSTYYLNRLVNLLDVYANGMLAAWIYARLLRKNQRPHQAQAATLIGLIALAALIFIAKQQSTIGGYEPSRRGQMTYRFVFSAFGGVFLIAGSRSIRWVRKAYSNQLIRFLSAVSLNFYIWHQVIAVRLKQWHIPAYTGVDPQKNAGAAWQNQYTLLCFLIAFLFAVAVTYLIERPIAKRFRKTK